MADVIMAKETMRRQASDNEYLHKDFHGALSNGIDYLELNYGAEAVREYLRQFTKSYYAPVIADIGKRGLIALKEHFDKIYFVEGGRIQTTLTEDELILEVEACPAVMHMREQGYTVAKLFSKTDKTVNETLCEGTPFAAEMIEYDPKTGHSVQRFYRRLK